MPGLGGDRSAIFEKDQHPTIRIILPDCPIRAQGKRPRLSLFEVETMAEANLPYLAAGPSPSFAAITQDDPDAVKCCWSFTASFKGYETDLLPMIDELQAAGDLKLRGETVAIISSDNP